MPSIAYKTACWTCLLVVVPLGLAANVIALLQYARMELGLGLGYGTGLGGKELGSPYAVQTLSSVFTVTYVVPQIDSGTTTETSTFSYTDRTTTFTVTDTDSRTWTQTFHSIPYLPADKSYYSYLSTQYGIVPTLSTYTTTSVTTTASASFNLYTPYSLERKDRISMPTAIPAPQRRRQVEEVPHHKKRSDSASKPTLALARRASSPISIEEATSRLTLLITLFAVLLSAYCIFFVLQIWFMIAYTHHEEDAHDNKGHRTGKYPTKLLQGFCVSFAFNFLYVLSTGIAAFVELGLLLTLNDPKLQAALALWAIFVVYALIFTVMLSRDMRDAHKAQSASRNAPGIEDQHGTDKEATNADQPAAHASDADEKSPV